ncbi:MAG TPA: hypothetical protein PKC30_05040 [Saprospiraceae bacterium]|nr:hypothetical protein [Saprospiraceae bacterium]
MLKRYILFILSLGSSLTPHSLYGFTDSPAIDFLRSTGKIYSVVVLILAVFAGMILFIIRIDKKLTNLENQIKDEHKTS